MASSVLWISRKGFLTLRSPNLWNSPWLMLPRVCEGDYTVYKFYSIAEEKVISLKKRRRGGEEEAKLVGSSWGWIALFDDRNKHVFLSNPVVGRHFKLPVIDALRDRDGNKVVVEESSSVSKVIVSWPPYIGFGFSRAMMSLDGSAKLAVCRPLRSTHWTLLSDNTMHHDFVYSAAYESFTCLADGKLHDWELDTWEEGKEIETKNGNLHFEGVKDWSFIPDLPLKHIKVDKRCGIKRYIVWAQSMGCRGKQYLVTQNIVDKTIGFQVYEIDNHRGKIVAKDLLDGQAMFVGLNHSFALPTSDFPEFKPDSIYFAGYDEIGIYDYKTRTFLNFDYPLDHGEGIMWFNPIDYNL